MALRGERAAAPVVHERLHLAADGLRALWRHLVEDRDRLAELPLLQADAREEQTALRLQGDAPHPARLVEARLHASGALREPALLHVEQPQVRLRFDAPPIRQ